MTEDIEKKIKLGECCPNGKKYLYLTTKEPSTPELSELKNYRAKITKVEPMASAKPYYYIRTNASLGEQFRKYLEADEIGKCVCNPESQISVDVEPFIHEVGKDEYIVKVKIQSTMRGGTGEKKHVDSYIFDKKVDADSCAAMIDRAISGDFRKIADKTEWDKEGKYIKK